MALMHVNWYIASNTLILIIIIIIIMVIIIIIINGKVLSRYKIGFSDILSLLT